MADDDGFFSWAERTRIRAGELDTHGLMVMAYCVGVLRGGQYALVPEEARKDGHDVPDDAAETLVIGHIRKILHRYAQVHEGNAELIRSIINDWSDDAEAT